MGLIAADNSWQWSKKRCPRDRVGEDWQPGDQMPQNYHKSILETRMIAPGARGGDSVGVGIVIRIVSLVFLVIAAWSYGLAVGHYEFPPFAQIRSTFKTVQFWRSNDAPSPQDFGAKSFYAMRAAILAAFPPKRRIAMVGDSLIEIAEWSGIFPDVDIANYGISGDTVEGVLARVPSILQGNSDKVFVMIGINDLLRGHSVSSIIPAYKNLVQALGRGGAHVFVQSTLCMSDDAYVNSRVLELNAELRTFCDANPSRCEFIEIAGSICAKGQLDSRMTVDGVHLSPLGYQRWRDAIAQYMGRK
jgi:lysophospholipase L1-like esterase